MNRLLPLSLLVLAAQFGVQANPVMGTDVLRYWYTSDDGDGPSRSAWSRHLKISWDNVNGDYLDAAGVPQGGVPFAQASVTSVGPLSIALDKPQAFRKGILLRLSGKSNPHLSFAGRLSATPPTLTVKRSDGIEKIVPALSLAAWSMSSHRGFDTRQSARLNAGEGSVMVLFDIPSDAVSATLNLNVVAKNSHASTLSLFALYPPGVFYPREHAAVPGIAATVANETALKTHPAVIRAGDFDLRHKSLFDGISQSENVSKEYLPDPLDPKRIIYRSMFKQRDGSADADQNWRGSLSLTLGTMLANKADPLLPTANVTKELFGRMCFKMEADWLARNDANKMALGWDLRLGYWVQANRGYWQQTTGNGGTRGTGLKLLRTNKDGSKQWEYQGHSIRMEAGQAPLDPAHPHDALRPITSYTYHLDQFDFNGTGERWGNAVIERDRWHCIEQQVKINTLRPMTQAEVEDALRAALYADAGASLDATGKSALKESLAAMSFTQLDGKAGPLRARLPNKPLLTFKAVPGGYSDHFGNMQANPDGVMRTWIDGVPVGERTAMRWFRHPDMGIEGPWINWFFGGKQAADHEMHYQMADFVLAREYIGLPKNFARRN
jgi:hypothetical protein